MERENHDEKGPVGVNNPLEKQVRKDDTRNDLLKAIRQRTRTHNVATVTKGNDFSGLIEIRSLAASARSAAHTGVSGLITLSGIQVAPAIGPAILLEPGENDGVGAGKMLAIVTLVAAGIAIIVITLTLMHGSFELPSFLGALTPTSHAAVMPASVDSEQGHPDFGMNTNGLAAFAVDDRNVDDKAETEPESSSPPKVSSPAATVPDKIVKKKSRIRRQVFSSRLKVRSINLKHRQPRSMSLSNAGRRRSRLKLRTFFSRDERQNSQEKGQPRLDST